MNYSPLSQPLTSFLCGIECISEIQTEWEKSLQLDPQLFLSSAKENFAAVAGALQSIFSTNVIMTMTINRCVDYTKASKRIALIPHPEPINLGGALKFPIRIVGDLQSQFEIKLRPWSADVSAYVATDKQWLQENILCLLSNAVKHSCNGCVVVSVHLADCRHLPLSRRSSPAHNNNCTINTSVTSGAAGNAGKAGNCRSASPNSKHAPYLRIEVRDTGVGLSDEEMRILFNASKQAQRLAGGAGLGLFCLAKRVEALQGQYGVERRGDGVTGSVFWFTLPYHPCSHATSSVHSSSSGGSSSGGGGFGRIDSDLRAHGSSLFSILSSSVRISRSGSSSKENSSSEDRRRLHTSSAPALHAPPSLAVVTSPSSRLPLPCKTICERSGSSSGRGSGFELCVLHADAALHSALLPPPAPAPPSLILSLRTLDREYLHR